jgi:hypothetical protein
LLRSWEAPAREVRLGPYTGQDRDLTGRDTVPGVPKVGASSDARPEPYLYI